MGQIINKKGFFTLPSGEEVLDLTDKTLEFTNLPVVLGAKYPRAEHEMRPDLIALEVYTDPEAYDIILKYNGISNPYTLSKEDILLIPERSQFERNIKDPDFTQRQRDFVSKYVDRSKKPTEDKRKLEFDQKEPKKNDTQATEQLPPNFAKEAGADVTIKGGKIHYGSSIGRNQEFCDDPIEKSALLKKLIKNDLRKNRNGENN